MDPQIGIVQPQTTDLGQDELAAVEKLQQGYHNMRSELGKVIVGQEAVIEELLIALFCKGHTLLVGVPGLAKTLLIATLAKVVDLKFNRIQFTPDLMPSDITGTDLIQEDPATGRRQMIFAPGPIFANIVLADEINRTPPKTQAALLEAMQEYEVTYGGTTYPLERPFFVLATQNPIEQSGTYPLPEAQLDRFLLKLAVPLPAREEEMGVLRAHHAGFDPRDLAAAGVRPVAGPADLAAARAAAQRVGVADPVLGYIVDLCRATRSSPSLELGASPRGATALLHSAKAWAWLLGRSYVIPDDVKALARATLRHRIRLRPEASLEGVTPDGVLDAVLATVPTPR